MQIILLERISRLGNMGQTVDVKPGFARNFLLPQGKALPATKANLEKFEAKRTELETQNNDAKAAATITAEAINGVELTIARQSSETGQLFGSVKSRDVEEALAGAGHTVSRSLISIGTPMKTVGEYKVRVAFHPEVVVYINVSVERLSS
jgi:large subunit ribosomal protein L9